MEHQISIFRSSKAFVLTIKAMHGARDGEHQMKVSPCILHLTAHLGIPMGLPKMRQRGFGTVCNASPRCLGCWGHGVGASPVRPPPPPRGGSVDLSF